MQYHAKAGLLHKSRLITPQLIIPPRLISREPGADHPLVMMTAMAMMVMVIWAMMVMVMVMATMVMVMMVMIMAIVTQKRAHG